MKRIIYFIVASLLVMLATTSCEEWLTVEPEGDIVLKDYWQNETQATQVLAACYLSMTDRNVMERMMVWGELRSDNVASGNSMPTSMNQVMNYDINANSEYCTWGVFYTTINLCNSFLYYAPGVVEKDPDFSEEECKSMEAEALTIRALCYFYLVRTFNNVPWVDEPSIGDNQNYQIEATSGDSILTLIQADLRTALLNARERFDDAQYNKGRVNKNAVRALLADVSLWKQDYASCVKYCEEIINTEEYSLEDGEDMLKNVFYKGNSTESIFELQFDDKTMINSRVLNYYGRSFNNYGYWSFPIELVNGDVSPFSYKMGSTVEGDEDIDIRRKDFLVPFGEIEGENVESYYPFKYVGTRTESTSGVSNWSDRRSTTPNWIVYRLADAYLMEAEALVEMGASGNEEKIVSLVNQTYCRANNHGFYMADSLRASVYNTQDELRKLVLRERQREFMFEGKRYFDLLRLAIREDDPQQILKYVSPVRESSIYQPQKLTVLNAFYMPIAQSALDANSALEQNPFYDK